MYICIMKTHTKKKKSRRKSKYSFMLFVVEINFNVFTLHSSKKKNPSAHRFLQSLTVWEDTDGIFFFIATISLTAGATTYYVMST